MTDFKGDIKNAKDKIAGEVKEVIGKITDNEELELKGKIQSSQSDLKEKAREIKESVAGTINDLADKKKADEDNR